MRAKRLNIARERGFTALEMIVAVAVLGALMYVVMPMLASTLSISSKFETNSRLNSIRQTVLAGYQINAFEIDSEPGNQLVVGGQAVLTSGMIAIPTTLAWAEKFASSSAGILYRDGYSQPFRFFVSTRLANDVNGTTLYSHKIAVVSAGRNGRIDAGTAFDETTGVLVLKGDDMGTVIDGFEVEYALFELTKKRIDTIASGYQSYFQTRFQSNSSRDTNVNYFVNASRGGADPAMFDGAGSVGSSGGGDVTADSVLATTLGLATTNFQDGYGHPIMIDNSSDLVRTPDNMSAAMQAPPYTVIVKTSLPGGLFAAQAVVGSY